MSMLETRNQITLCGKEFRLRDLTVDDLADLQDFVYRQLPDPVVVAKDLSKDQPVEVAKSLLMQAYDDVRAGARRLGSPEATEVLAGYEGLREMLFLMGRREYPHMSRDDWGRLLLQAAAEDLDDVRKSVDEEKGGAIPAPKVSSSVDMDDPLSGVIICDTSPGDTVGRPTKSVA